MHTACAKGLSDGAVTFMHARRDALMPIVTIAGLQVGNLISGAVLVATVFPWPGLGTLALRHTTRIGWGRHRKPRRKGLMFNPASVDHEGHRVVQAGQHDQLDQLLRTEVR